MRPRRLVTAGLLGSLLLLSGCSGGDSGSTPAVGVPAEVVDAGSQPYRTDLPELASHLYLPAGSTAHRLPLVILVPGGGWTSADPGGLVPLATALATDGLAAVTTTYRTAGDHAYFPLPVQDVVCAVDEAAARLRLSGIVPDPVVVVGHSAGAQLAALAALAGHRYQQGCASPEIRPDGLVGLSGPYDVAAAGGIAQSLFSDSSAADPSAWVAGNPVVQANLRPELPVVLVHGGSDEVVPLMFSQVFEDALRAGGHEVRLLVLPGLGHQDVYRPEAASGPIEQLVSQLSARG